MKTQAGKFIATSLLLLAPHFAHANDNMARVMFCIGANAELSRQCGFCAKDESEAKAQKCATSCMDEKAIFNQMIVTPTGEKMTLKKVISQYCRSGG